MAKKTEASKDVKKTETIEYLCRYIGKERLHLPGETQEVLAAKAKTLITNNVAKRVK